MDEPPAKRARRLDSAAMWDKNDNLASPRSPRLHDSRDVKNDSRREERSRRPHQAEGPLEQRRRSRSRSDNERSGYKKRQRSRSRSYERDQGRDRDRDRSKRTERPRDRDGDRDREGDVNGHRSRRDDRDYGRDRDRSRSRDRDRHRSAKDHPPARRERDRSRSRSPHRNGTPPVRTRSPAKQQPTRTDHDRHTQQPRIKREDQESNTLDEKKHIPPASQPGPRDARTKREPLTNGHSRPDSKSGTNANAMDIDPKLEGDDGAESDTDVLLRKFMGFSTFKTTQNKKVPGNQIYGVRKEKKTEYRQYMNRVGGFNRPLSPG